MGLEEIAGIFVALWQEKRVLITGVCGTVGRELLRQVVTQGPGRVPGFDN